MQKQNINLRIPVSDVEQVEEILRRYHDEFGVTTSRHRLLLDLIDIGIRSMRSKLRYQATDIEIDSTEGDKNET